MFLIRDAYLRGEVTELLLGNLIPARIRGCFVEWSPFGPIALFRLPTIENIAPDISIIGDKVVVGFREPREHPIAGYRVGNWN